MCEGEARFWEREGLKTSAFTPASLGEFQLGRVGVGSETAALGLT